MTPREIAVYLNECTDEEFAETFALLHQGMLGRGIPTGYDDKGIVEIMDVKCLCNYLGRILNEIKGE